ncbi:uncharacterized protein LOC113507404 [Trichoplusia ni]|uniref:Uncharacterized protein LOC113507404 n=1 Tax=Trichoplusia ni TaxID=7111 RepID=A0A7E5WYW9_TRINI|nr:uncharacterized protein LOC113507404 [Trichoplusia ni]
MRRQFVMPLALLFIAFGVSSYAQSAADEAERRLTVDEGAPLTVECALRVEERAEWRLDGAPPPPDMRPAGEAAGAGRLTARLRAPAARPQHAGVYTCARQPAQRIRVLVRAAPAPAAQPGTARPLRT